MKVLFVCSGGMSSAIVVNAFKKAEKNGVNMEVHAIGTNEVEEEVKNGWDVVMVAPQIRHRFDSVKNLQRRNLFRVASYRRKHTHRLAARLY